MISLGCRISETYRRTFDPSPLFSFLRTTFKIALAIFQGGLMRIN
jgi:hypothetical protein